MKDKALHRYRLIFCLCLAAAIAAVIGGCSDGPRTCTPRIELSAEQVLSTYQLSLSQENLLAACDLVDDEVRDECFALAAAYTRYGTASKELADLVRARYGEKLADSFTSSTVATFRCVAIQSLFFSCSQGDIAVYAGAVELVARGEDFLMTVGDIETDFILQKCGNSWKISRLSGTADWSRSIQTATRQLDSLSDRFGLIGVNIDSPSPPSESEVTSMLMLRKPPK